MDTYELDELYRRHLMTAIRPPIAGHVTAWQARAQLIWMETAAGLTLDPARVRSTWVWSDLHLDHAGIIGHGKRPHADAAAMTRELCAAWRRRVLATDTIVCLGDVAVGHATTSTLARLATLPGYSVLVPGNHDLLPGAERPKAYGFDQTAPTLVCNTRPTLLFTHEPLETVPDGCWNLHGHIHGTGPEKSERHLNVCVERTGYEPVRLSDVIRRTQAGRRKPDGYHQP